jgi:arylsulfatase A-like enzyme
MLRQQIQVALICQIVLALAGASTSQAAEAPACDEIVAACKQAGFVPGGGRAGGGLEVGCVRPIMQGRAQPRRASKPLPQIDPQLVAACKKSDPTFGQRNAPGDVAEPSPPPAAAPLAPPPPLPAGAKRPNIVFVLADDFSLDLLQYMPNVLKMQKDGATFANYFVTDSLCCPSRSSIFTGRYPHSTGIFKNHGQDGGYHGFLSRGHENVTFATSLLPAGYRTAFLGKYLNGYEPRQHQVPPGWKEWDVAGSAYKNFNYDLRENGNVVHYGNKPTDYLTDVVSAKAVNFIKQAPGTPFMIEIATFAPHSPYTPAPRDANAFPGLKAPRSPAFNAAPDADAPKWLAAHAPLADAELSKIDIDYRKRAQAVLGIDAMIGALQAAVREIGAADNTYFVFSSDNGYHMGEHRMTPGKMTAFNTDIHVPLIVTGPGVPAGLTINEIAQNIDLNPTFVELGYATPPPHVDGRSLAPLLHGQRADGWRTVALIEHHRPPRNVEDPDLPDFRGAESTTYRGGNPTTYEAIRMATAVYVEYEGGEKEYHDLATDPNELRNTFAALPADRKAALHAALDAVQHCHDADCHAAERIIQSATRN